jgi:toxin-antitoxin system PIN domain toxin
VWLVDTNVLLYAANADAPQHTIAGSWLDGALSGDEPVGFAETAILGFVRVSTHPAAFTRQLRIEEACGLAAAWLAAMPAVQVFADADHHGRLCALLAATGIGGNLVSDAHLAALAIEHKATVVTFDRDFSRFPGVKVHVPA